jgi:PTH1 family peptidyl-tRNA hydrolase
MEPRQKFLIVGLGNPGRRYRQNRHNFGYMVADKLSEHSGIRMSTVQSKAIIGTGDYCGKPIIIAKPQTFMNLSGAAVGPLQRYYRIPLANLLVVYDEIDLPLGHMRLREQGGSGGHNGMKSIIEQVGNEFPRMRLGVGRPPGFMEPADYVLQNFNAEEMAVVMDVTEKAIKAIQIILQDGIDIAMTGYNGPSV